MIKPMIWALFAGLSLGIGGSFSIGVLSYEGLVMAIIAIACIVLPMAFFLIKNNRQKKYNIVH